MLTKTLIVLAILFAALGSLRWAIAKPRPRWLAPAIAGIAAYALLFRFGIVGLAVSGAAAGAAWLFQKRTAPGSPPPDPSLEEARAILGVGPAASARDIRAAHRERIAAAHPDRGGSAADAARLNVARDVLLKAAARRA